MSKARDLAVIEALTDLDGITDGTTGQVLTTDGSGTFTFEDAASGDVVNDTTPQLGGDLETNSNDIKFADNDKAIFGAGSDLQIYHDGSHSYIHDVGTGDLRLKVNDLTVQSTLGTYMMRAVSSGPVSLYYSNFPKLDTTSTGINVTGNIALSGTVDGRDVATDGTKLDGIAVNATNVSALTDLSISDGTNGQVLTTNGSGTFTFEDAASPYGDTEVSSHLNTGTANADEVLSWDGSDFEWIEKGNTFSTFSYIATNSQTTFSGADSNSQTLAYTADKIIVTLNGIVLKNTTDYTATNGTSVVLTSGAQTDQELTVMAFDVFEVANVDYSNISNTPTLPTDFVSAASGGTFGGNVAMTGDLTVDTNTLYVNSTNNKVGIGTSSLGRDLTVAASVDGLGLGLVGRSSDDRAYTIYYKNNGTTAVGSIYTIPSSNTFNINAYSGNSLSFNVNGAEKMRIDSSGNVGIGTDSPSGKLHVKDQTDIAMSNSADGQLILEGNGYSGAIALNATGMQIYQNSSARSIIFGNNETEQMRIDSSGNVLIGSDSGDAFNSESTLRLQKASGNNYVQIKTATDSEGGILIGDTDDDFVGGMIYNNSLGYLRFNSNNAENMRLESDGDLHVDGNVVAYSTTISDIRLKKDIAPIENAVTKVQQLNGCTFTYLKDDRKSAGLIAQDVEKVLPSAVIEDEAVFHGEEGETYKTVQYDQVIGLLVEAVKELKAEIEELKNASSK